MAQMNPKEPACQVMLGIAAWKSENYHLAITAFENAITLKSPQADLLNQKINVLQEFIRRSQSQKLDARVMVALIFGVPAALVLRIVYKLIRRKRSLQP